MFANRLSTAKTVAAAVLVALAASFAGNTPARADYIKVGVLTCTVGGGVGLIITSRKSLTCTFAPEHRRAERYGGTLTIVGVDLGVTRGAVIVWAVLAPTAGFGRGVLAGRYAGVSAQASLVVGAGANVLVGGSNRSFALQPLSVQGQVGVNIAAGISAVRLYYTPY